MPTARSIIEQALRKIHVLGRGQNLTSDEAQDALTALNNLLSSWTVEGGLVYTETRETFSCTGATSYSIGSGGDFNTTRPVDVAAVYVTQGTIDYPLQKYDQQQYAAIQDKSTTGASDYYYYDNNYPLGNLFLYPIPDASYTVTIYSVKPLTSFSALTTNVDLPEGYERALVFNLAVELAPDYEREASESVKKTAGIAKGNVFSANTRNSNNVSTVDEALLSRGGYNIYRGY